MSYRSSSNDNSNETIPPARQKPLRTQATGYLTKFTESFQRPYDVCLRALTIANGVLVYAESKSAAPSNTEQLLGQLQPQTRQMLQQHVAHVAAVQYQALKIVKDALLREWTDAPSSSSTETSSASTTATATTSSSSKQITATEARNILASLLQFVSSASCLVGNSSNTASA
jgi:hypothetical protein